MSLINISNLTFGYDGAGENIFENVNLQLDTSWRIGLVGRNGRGKTTLLRILCGELKFSGSVSAQVNFEYFPYSPRDTNALTIDVLREASLAEDWRIMREASLLGVSEEALWRQFSLLSHGERTKALLSAMFLREGSFLLIDEPTNHLDLAARQKLRDYLSRKSGFILVSHDRALLDGCVTHILSINRSNIELSRGSFSTFMRDKENKDRYEAGENEKLKKDISRLKESSRRAAAFSENAEKEKFSAQSSGLSPDRGYLGHKSAKLMQRSKNIERRREELINEKSALLKNVDSAEELKISPLRFHSARLAELRDVSVSFGGKTVISAVSFEINEGDVIALRGKNGCGKTSILRLILGDEIEHTGEVSKSGQLKISYVPQSAEHLSGSLSDFALTRGIELPLFLSILSKLGLQREHFATVLGSLSEGQKKKVLLAASLCERAHLYIWDEPLNYLDLLSRVQLERLIARCSPTMLLVEHDEAFCENVCTDTIELG